MFSFFALFLLMIVYQNVQSHLCVWAPVQRGGFDISTPGSHICYRKPGPCGNVNASSTSPRTTLTAGSRYRVEFQQNLNHYYTGQPGSLDVSFAVGLNPSESDFQVLHSFSDYNAMNQITQTNFTVSVNLPNQPCDQCVLRVRYLSNNPEEEDHGTTFHQCSDVKLTASTDDTPHSSGPSEEISPIVPPIRQNDPHDCCAPESFTTNFFHIIPSTQSHAQGMIYYDKKAQQMRVTVSTNHGQGNTTYDGTFDMWMNFTSGYQYYYNRNSGACDLYGLDYWNDWCFGNTFNQSEDFVAADVRCSGGRSPHERCDQWRNGGFLFETYANNQCFPASISRQNGERYEYFEGRTEPIPPSVFVPNPVCVKKREVKHASPGWMRFHL
uniref:Uncharacterized protein n=1 Tax=Philodina roseola TaxID=96448 RepID=B2L3J1_PHIRO|nr:unknown [Philodina roseola]